MQPIYQNPNQPTTAGVYRTSLILWAAMLFAQFLLLVVLYFAKPEVFNFGANGNESNEFGFILIGLAIIGLLAFAVSFVVKARVLAYAIENHALPLVQNAHIVAWALCEAISLFGLLAAFAFDSRFFFLWFAVGILGMLLHFPRRAQFEAAAFTGIK